MDETNKDRCQHCLDDRSYSKVISACEYDGIIREKLIEFKFAKNKLLAKVFSEIMAEKIKMTKLNLPDIIISVPVHQKKFEERGYNQSQLIAKKVSDVFNIPILDDVLVKTRVTENQSELGKAKRLTNVVNAFKIDMPSKITNKKILLVDDIITTGATVNECSKILTTHGAAEVFVATVAAGKGS